MTGQTGAHERLAADRASTLERLNGLERELRGIIEAADTAGTDDEHDPEGATIAFERAQVDSLTQDTLARLAAVRAALARLDAGTYGVCAVCGRQILDARLEALPTATTCVTCLAP